ncbi:MAG: DUF3037 domain-containing protein [Myxococcota bacterium]
MLARAYDYAVVRVVPRIDRGEFINAGVVLYCPTARHLAGRMRLDVDRLRVLAPATDPRPIVRQLEALEAICAGRADGGPIASLEPAERFHWIVAPRSAVVQTSAVHGGTAEDLAGALDHLLRTMVDPCPLAPCSA